CKGAFRTPARKTKVRAYKMKEVIKALIRAGVRSIFNLGVRTSIGRYSIDQVLKAAMGRTVKIGHHGVELTFAVPNTINHFRSTTFANKEPETLEWIDRMDRDSILWDIGANVGLYTCYAAMARGCKVFAFEPSVFNLALLAQNTFLNGLDRKVVIIPLP